MEEKEEKVEKIQKLYPFEALETDYYMGEEAGGGVGRDSEEELRYLPLRISLFLILLLVIIILKNSPQRNVHVVSHDYAL